MYISLNKQYFIIILVDKGVQPLLNGVILNKDTKHNN